MFDKYIEVHMMLEEGRCQAWGAKWNTGTGSQPKTIKTKPLQGYRIYQYQLSVC